MKIVGTLLLALAASSVAQAQSLLGESGVSPNDPPPRPAFKKRDPLQITFREPGPAKTSYTISAEVVDIRPNGVLVIQAIQRRRMNGVEELLRLSGEVAPEAVRGREVNSDRVAHLSVSYEGPVAPGGVGWIIGRIWPF